MLYVLLVGVSIDKYYAQRLRGLPDSAGTYVYNRRRYRCKDCGKTFAESNSFLAPRQRTIGNRLRQIRAQKKITRYLVISAEELEQALHELAAEGVCCGKLKL